MSSETPQVSTVLPMPSLIRKNLALASNSIRGMTATPSLPPPGWYPDPTDNTRQRYWDGGQWAAQPITTEHKGNSVRVRAAAVVVGVVAVVGFGLANQLGEDEKTAGSSSTTTSAARAPAAAPGTVPPSGVTFSTESGMSKTSVYADFDITDALFMTLTKSVARTTTRDILRYASTRYPQADQVVVRGRFPTEDAYGNGGNTIVLNVIYTRSTLDRINWDGINSDGIWNIRDGGFVHRELQ